MTLSDKTYENPKALDEIVFKLKDVKEFIKKLKKLPNAEGGENCQCVPDWMVDGGKGFKCDFCKEIDKLAGEKLI